MNRYYKFKPDQTVKLWDGYIDSYHYGTVVSASKQKVTIKWYNNPETKKYTPESEGNIWRDLQVIQTRK